MSVTGKTLSTMKDFITANDDRKSVTGVTVGAVALMNPVLVVGTGAAVLGTTLAIDAVAETVKGIWRLATGVAERKRQKAREVEMARDYAEANEREKERIAALPPEPTAYDLIDEATEEYERDLAEIDALPIPAKHKPLMKERKLRQYKARVMGLLGLGPDL